MRDPDSDSDGPENDALREALGEAYRNRVEIPPTFDREMLARADLPLARLRRRRRMLWAVPAAVGFAAAATLALLVFTGDRPGPADGAAPHPVAAAADAATAADATPRTAPSPAAADATPSAAPADATAPAAAVAAAVDEGGAEPDAGAGAGSIEPPGPPPVRPRPPRRRGDLDEDGRVDVLDAFLLARRLDAGDPGNPAWDASGDGRVDRADVDRVAYWAVSLSGGEP
jgi:hypothetical protein